MPSHWQIATIGEIAEKVAMGPFGSSIKVETFVREGVPVISGQHLHGFRVDDSPGFNFISQGHAQRLANANVQRGDIVFTHAGNIGAVAYIPDGSEFDRYVVSQRQFYMRCDRSKAIPEFITMYFKSPDGQHQLLANRSQVGVPSIAQPVSYLRTIEIPLPPLPEQRAITHILGTLDDKIELNRRMNETLEEMARALFQSWFVDFDPVRAKMEGRDTGLPPDVAALFPDRLVESELGLTPEGWQLRKLGELVQIVKGRSYRSVDLRESKVALVTLKSIKRGGGYSPDGLKEYTGDYRQEQVVKTGHVVVAQTDVTQAAEVIGRTALVQESPDYPTLVASLDLLLVRPAPPLTSPYLHRLLQSHAFVSHSLAHVNGTTVLHMQKDAVPEFRFPLPLEPIIDSFSRQIAQLDARSNDNAGNSHIITNMRDVLMPRLVSGEMGV